ncbi:MAG: hypothetical protein CMI54_03000 [Parcubacteria group bacterium]|nr:hypothetical protein [Parcubacteria group bacterium]
MKSGDLIQSIKGGRLGIIIEIFGDLDPGDPWVRVQWTAPYNSFEWCKQSGILLASNKKGTTKVPFSGATCESGSL